jgi:cytochrome c oxidase subunit III
MSEPTIIDTSELTIHNNGQDAPLFWGILGLLLIESMVFSSLLSSYFYLRLDTVEWPPAGLGHPKLLLPTINTVLLIGSAYFVYRADSGIRKNDVTWLKRGLSIALLMAVAFLVIKYIEFRELDYRWSAHTYGSINWTISGFHAAHVIALVLKTVVVLFLSFRGYFDGERNLPVQVNGIYWYFVVVVWIPIYAVLYWTPRVL